MISYLRNFFLTTLLCVSLSAPAQIYELNWPYKNHLELRELKGSVMKIKELHYKNNPGQAIGEKAKGAFERYSIEEFNQHGNRKSLTRHGSSGQITEQELYHYNAAGKLVYRVITDPRAPGSETKDTLIYDVKGRLVRETHKLVASKMVLSSYSYVYDASGKYVGNTSQLPYYQSTTTTTLNYEPKFVRVELISKSKTDHTKTIRRYDNKTRKLVDEEHLYQKGTSTRSVFSYDKNGHRILAERYRNGSNEPESKEVISYKFDAKGNWIQKIQTFHSGGSTFQAVSEREISYY